MSDQKKLTVSENDLHAFVDGQFSETRMREIEDHLKTNAEDAQMVASWQAQNEALQKMFQETAEDDDDRLVAASASRAGPRLKVPLQAVAALAIFAAGLISGLPVARYFSTLDNTVEYVQNLPEAARAGYVIYTSEVRHPVEVGAEEESHLVAWLGKRLGVDFVAPNLTKVGFRLVGGRLVPYAGKPGALLMYEDATGERLTVLIGRQPGASETGFKFSQTGDVRTFYWMDGELGYALSGAIDRKNLEALAYEVYQQI
ncbi:MAG: anti-sigma factor [Amylibacter sp.]|nr:anti-sigma factor [Amylibacter sp.]